MKVSFWPKSRRVEQGRRARVFADDARGWQCPFVLCLHPQGCLRRGARASRTHRVFTRCNQDKMKSHWSRAGHFSNATVILIRRGERHRDSHRWSRPCGDRGQDQGDAAAAREPQAHTEAGRRRGRIPPRVSDPFALPLPSWSSHGALGGLLVTRAECPSLPSGEPGVSGI